MLILPHADRFGIDFDQFRQGVHQTPADGDRAADRDILIRKFFAGHLGRRIDRRAAFVDHDQRDGRRQPQCPHKRFGLPSRRPVAHGDRLDVKTRAERREFRFRFGGLSLAGVRVDRGVVQQFALAVQTDHLAAGAKTRIDAHHPFGAQRRRQQQLSQVVGEDPNRFGISTILERQPQFGFQRAAQQPFVAVAHGLAHLVAVRAVAGDEERLQDRQRLFLRRRQGQAENLFAFPPAHGQHPVRRHCRRRFLPVKVILELDSPGFLALDHFAVQDRFPGEQVPQSPAGRFVLVDDFRQNVPRAFQRLLDRGHASGLVDKVRGGLTRIAAGLGQDPPGQRFQPFFAGDRGFGAPLGFVRQINIFQHGQRLGGRDPGFEFFRQVPVFFQAGENGLAPAVQFGQLRQTIPNGGDLDFVQAAGDLLAIAGDKGNSGVLLQKLGDGLDLFRQQRQFGTDGGDMLGIHLFSSSQFRGVHLYIQDSLVWATRRPRHGRALEKGC